MPPSFAAITMSHSLRLVQPISTRMNVAALRASQDALGALQDRLLGTERVSESIQMGGFPACVVHVEHAALNDPRVVLYLHGGAYVAGGLFYARGFGGLLARDVGLRVYCAAYRLAPEHPFPAALDDARAAFQYLLDQGIAPRNILLVGESAGGGLCMALCLRLKDEGAPLPARVSVVSPWVNLMCAGASYVYNQRDDPSLSRTQLFDSARMYAGDRLRSPYVSPLFGDMSGLPPVQIIVGGDELLLSDSLDLHAALKQANVKCTLHVESGMWHAYPLFGVPESKEARLKIAAFLKGLDEGGDQPL